MCYSRCCLGWPSFYGRKWEPLRHYSVRHYIHGTHDLQIYAEYTSGTVSLCCVPFTFNGLSLTYWQRSGLVGCLSFTLVSIAEHNAQGGPSPITMAATRGAAMVVGVVASVVVNWVLWPFVARHDLRKGISSMMFYCSIIYRSKAFEILPFPPVLTCSRHCVSIRLLRDGE